MKHLVNEHGDKVLTRSQIIDRIIHGLNKRRVSDTSNYLIQVGTIAV